MSSVEIEDVLSSIRRLVSEDLRPGASAAAVRATPDQAPPAVPAHTADLVASKLLLTPALRVVQDAAPEPAPAPRAAEDWDEAEAAAFVNVEDDELPDGSGAAQSGGDVVSLTRAAAPEPVSPEPVPAEPLATEAEAAADLTQPVWTTPAEAAEPADMEAIDDWQDTLPEADATAAEGLEAEGPAASDRFDPAYDAVWADAAEAEVLRQLADEGVTARGTSDMPQAKPSEDDMVYEETLLRELVRDIIREELQGALGERITRNVRKLVRAEIARALALRDFE